MTSPKESPRGTGLRRAVGQLLLCPVCTGFWVASATTAGLVVAPRATRLACGALAVAAVSDFLQRPKVATRLPTTPRVTRVVVVTGASAGVGRAVARSFARRGDDVALLARHLERLEAAGREVEALAGSADGLEAQSERRPAQGTTLSR